MDSAFERPSRWIAFFSLAVLLAPVISLSYSGGPLDGLTGAPPESTCIACHSAEPGDGAVTIIGAPTMYKTDSVYTIEVQLQDPGQQRWGFEITVIDEQGNGAGTFSITDAVNTRLSDSSASGREYVKHTSTGTRMGTPDGPVSWSFDWMAPTGNVGVIAFYVAGNAANGDGTFFGDFIYTASVSFDADMQSSVNTLAADDGLPHGFALDQNYPNPFNPQTIIKFSLAKRDDVRLDVYNLLGRKVRTLVEDQLAAGSYSSEWDGRDGNGAEVASGVYLYRLTTSAFSESKRMVLIK